MRIQLFMEDATNDFGYVISSPTSDSKAGIYFARRLESKPTRVQHDVRWYYRYPLSYRDLEDMMQERGMEVDHFTLNRLVLKYATELDKRICPHLSPTNDSWQVDETYIEVKGEWKYLYRAVDSAGNTLDFMLRAKRDGKVAARFFRQVITAQHIRSPRVITVDKNAAYPVVIEMLKADEMIVAETKLRQSKYLNNVIEQDHRSIKRIVKPKMGFKSFNTARRTLSGKAMAMIRRGQVNGIEQGDSVSQAKFIEAIFGIIA